MIRTYVVELKNLAGHDVLEYCTTLREAKEVLIRMSNIGKAKGVSILCIYGQYFGEGFHQYRTLLVSSKGKNKFIKIKNGLSNY